MHCYLKENDTDMTNGIRLKTNKGLAIGSDKFVTDLKH